MRDQDLRAVTEVLAAGGRVLVLSDFDGTLAPIAPDPAAVRLAPAMRRLLATLAASSRARLAIISGRALADVRERVGVPGAVYAGCHGLEVEGVGVAWRHSEAERAREVLAALADTLARRLAVRPGVLVEPKGLAVALHYRNAGRGAAAVVTRAARAVVRGRPGLRLLRGKKVLEILPRVHWDKGECALWLRDRLAGHGPGPVAVLYVGDDRTDEHAFRALAGKALTVAVGTGRRRTAAARRVAGVADVERLLAALVARLETAA
jgi:trehalose-phosphatase